MMGTITDASWVATPTLRGNWATGDGSTTWRVPDLNGKSAGTVGAPFLRGDGTLSAAVAGTIQLDAFQTHSHSLNLSANSGTGAGYVAYGAGAAGVNAYGTSGTTAGREAAETRPLNVTGCFIIKVFGAVNNTGSVDANQIVTTLGIQDSRIAALEATEKKVYGAMRIGAGHINPTSPVNIHWSEEQVPPVGGITYTGVGGTRAMKVPIGGVYKVTVTLLSNAANSVASVRHYRSGSLLFTPFATYGAVSSGTMHGECLIRLLANDELNVAVTAGGILNDGTNHYNAFVIERVDN
jgi:microcystin-dependent protein